MSWSLFENKTNPDTGKQNPAGTSEAPVEPFYNVMPKARVIGGDAIISPHANTSPVAPTPAPEQKPQSTAPKVVSSDSPPAILPDSAKTELGASLKPTPQPIHVIGALIAVVLALAAIGYVVISISSGSGPLAKLWKKDAPNPDTVVVTPTPTPASVVYVTPTEWREQYFAAADCQECADSSDPDADGLVNSKEYEATTDPKNSDTDGDGLADGDEVAIFGCDPTNKYTAKNQEYTDSDDLRGGWDCVLAPEGEVKLTASRIQDIQTKAAEFKIHEPTRTTLGASLAQYELVTSNPSVIAVAEVPAGTDTSPDAVLSRDVQRLNTIQKIGAALLAYKADQKEYPIAISFADMAAKIKPYNAVATNTNDPINVAPFVYGYELDPVAGSFALTYYSETQKQQIRYTEAQAKNTGNTEAKQTRDSQRMDDLDKIRAALLIYSAASAQPSENFSFPKKGEYQQKIAPQYIQSVPKDPLTGKDYEYQVGVDNSTFTLKAVLELPSQGTTGFLCNQEECTTY